MYTVILSHNKFRMISKIFVQDIDIINKTKLLIFIIMQKSSKYIYKYMINLTIFP